MTQSAPGKQPPIILEDDIHALTAKGRAELSEAGTSRSQVDLEVLVLIDGKSTAANTAGRAQGLGIRREDALEAMAHLADDGLIELAKPSADVDFVDFFGVEGQASPEKAKLAEARRAAAATAALLKERGYFVSIARRPEAKPSEPPKSNPTVLCVDDEPLTIKMLKHVLEGEGFDVRTAMNRQETLEQLRRPPIPDLVLLDVMLPDTDGFQILERFRQHPALRRLPVIMLTSSATRGAVLKGLLGGANGYVTKPFELPVLVKAVHAVLGMSEEHDIIVSKDPWSVA